MQKFNKKAKGTYSRVPVTCDQKYKYVCPFLSTASIKCNLCSTPDWFIEITAYFDLRVTWTVEI